MPELSVSEISDVIRGILVNDVYLDIEAGAIGVDDSLVDGVGLGSLELSELRCECENRFGVQIAEADFNPVHFFSVGTLAAFLSESMSKAAAPAK